MKKTIFYVGLYDKDSKTQKIGTLSAVEIVSRVVMDAGYPGATISESFGIYTHEDGEIVREPSLRIEILDSIDAKDAKISEQLKMLLNQESILKETQVVTMDFV